MKRSPIRVLFIVPTLSVGGAERIITKLLPAMDPNRFQVSLVCTGDEGELFDHLTASGIDATALRAGGKRNALKALSRLSAYLRAARPDVVVLSGNGTTLVGRLAGVMTKVQHQIVWVHESLDTDGGSRLRGLADRALIPFTDTFLGVADSQLRFMSTTRKYPTARIRIIRSGVDVKDFVGVDGVDLAEELRAPPDTPTVAMVARLHPVKDHDTFLSAARIVLQTLPETRFLIIGDGPERTRLENLSRRMGIEKSVHFAGTRPDIDRLLPGIDIHVLSSHSESLPLAVLEGMACGRPVICTDVGGTREIIEHGVSGYLVPPQDPARLANHLTTLLTDPVLAGQMGAAGRSRVESEYSLEASVAETERFLEQLVRRNGQGADQPTWT